MPGECAEWARRCPVVLVDDLLEVPPDQRLQQPRDAPVEPHRIEQRLVIGRPLHHPGEPVALAVGRDVVEEVAVPETRSEEHTSELQSLMRISYAVFCLKKKKKQNNKK